MHAEDSNMAGVEKGVFTSSFSSRRSEKEGDHNLPESNVHEARSALESSDSVALDRLLAPGRSPSSREVVCSPARMAPADADPPSAPCVRIAVEKGYLAATASSRSKNAQAADAKGAGSMRGNLRTVYNRIGRLKEAMECHDKQLRTICQPTGEAGEAENGRAAAVSTCA